MLLLFTWLSTLFLIVSITIFILAYYLWTKRNFKGAVYMFLLLSAVGFWSFTAFLESVLPGGVAKVFASQLSYIAIVFVGPFWYIFSIEYTQSNLELKKRYEQLLYFISTILLLFVFTNGYHKLLWPTYNQAQDNLYSPVIYTHGFLYLVNSIYQYLLIILGIGVLVKDASTKKNKDVRQVIYLVLSISIPLMGNFVYSVMKLSVFGYDITPVLFSIATILLLINIWRNNFYSAKKLIDKLVYKEFDGGILVIDKNFLVIEFNEIAESLIHKGLKLGMDLQKLSNFNLVKEWIDNKSTFYIPELKKWYQVKTKSIHNDSNIYKAIFFYDVTEERNAYESVTDTKDLLNSILDFLPDGVFAVDNKGKITYWNTVMEVETGVKAVEVLGKNNATYSKIIYGNVRSTLLDYILSGKPVNKKQYDNIEVEKDSIIATINQKNKTYWLVAKPLFDKNGNVIGAIECMRDITKQKSIENELRDRVDTMVRLNNIMVKREDWIAELKEENAELRKKNEN